MSETTETVRAAVRGYIEDSFLYLRPGVELSNSDDLLAQGIVDSLGFVELVEEVQERFGIAVDDTEITEENFGSIDRIAGFVDRKRQSG
jgi:acyl carrier protein